MTNEEFIWTLDKGMQGPVFVPPQLREKLCGDKTGVLYAEFRCVTLAINDAIKGEIK